MMKAWKLASDRITTGNKWSWRSNRGLLIWLQRKKIWVKDTTRISPTWIRNPEIKSDDSRKKKHDLVMKIPHKFLTSQTNSPRYCVSSTDQTHIPPLQILLSDADSTSGIWQKTTYDEMLIRNPNLIAERMVIKPANSEINYQPGPQVLTARFLFPRVFIWEKPPMLW